MSGAFPLPAPAPFIPGRKVNFRLVRTGLNYECNAPVVAKY
jgi:hypothetical protein